MGLLGDLLSSKAPDTFYFTDNNILMYLCVLLCLLQLFGLHNFIINLVHSLRSLLSVQTKKA